MRRVGVVLLIINYLVRYSAIDEARTKNYKSQHPLLCSLIGQSAAMVYVALLFLRRLSRAPSR